MTMATKPLITSRDPKGRQTFDILEAVYDKAKLDGERAQRLNERGDELKAGFKKLIEELSVTNQFADEEVESNYGYLSGYKPKGITEQTNKLRELFPGIGFADEKLVELPLPENAEGYFAIPKWETVAPTYGEAVEKVFALIKKTRGGKFYNYREGQLDPKHLRQSAKTAKAFQTLGEQQKDYDILVVPAQFGICHRGRSVRRAREVFLANEFGLGTFAVGIMLLTHPERLGDYDDLYIDCAGDEYAPGGDGKFVSAPLFNFVGGEAEFDTYGIDFAYQSCGSASGFLQQ